MYQSTYLSLLVALASQAITAPVAQTVAAAAPAVPTPKSISKETNVTSSTAPAGQFYARDGGTYGHIGTTYFTNNFDTSLCQNNNEKSCAFEAFNTFSYLDSNPAVERDPPGNTNLCAVNTANGKTEHIWLSETVPLTDTTGLTFFNNITGGSDGSENTHNTGAAIIDVSADTPKCTRLSNGWWAAANGVPSYGNAGVVVGHTDDYIYVYGGGINDQSGNIYVGRVTRENAQNRAEYTYYNGNDWGRQGSATPVMTSTGGGSISYNVHLGGYLYFYSYIDSIFLRFANAPEGPWSGSLQVFSDTALTYQPNAEVNYDLTGATTVLKYSVAGQPHLQKIRTLTWN